MLFMLIHAKSYLATQYKSLAVERYRLVCERSHDHIEVEFLLLEFRIIKFTTCLSSFCLCYASVSFGDGVTMI